MYFTDRGIEELDGRAAVRCCREVRLSAADVGEPGREPLAPPRDRLRPHALCCLPGAAGRLAECRVTLLIAHSPGEELPPVRNRR